MIEVIKKMTDVLFSHINSLTKDLYECSHYDRSKNEENVQDVITRLEKEVKVGVKALAEHSKIIQKMQNEIDTKDQEIKEYLGIIKALSDENEDLKFKAQYWKNKKRSHSSASRSPCPKDHHLRSHISPKKNNICSPNKIINQKTSPSQKRPRPSSNKLFRDDFDLEGHFTESHGRLTKARSRPKRNHSLMILQTDSKLRIPTEGNLLTPVNKKKSLHSYLCRKSKEPKSRNLNNKNPNRNLSFTTINNISMQNLIGRGLGTYNSVLNKTLNPMYSPTVGRETSQVGGSPVGMTSIFNNPLICKKAGSIRANCGSKSICKSTFLQGSPADDTTVLNTPNFQKKLKRYISKRKSVLKKNNPG